MQNRSSEFKPDPIKTCDLQRAASRYIKDWLSNIKIGMSLEIATTLGDIWGSLIAAYIYSIDLFQVIFIIFGIVLCINRSYLHRIQENEEKQDKCRLDR